MSERSEAIRQRIHEVWQGEPDGDIEVASALMKALPAAFTVLIGDWGNRRVHATWVTPPDGDPRHGISPEIDEAGVIYWIYGENDSPGMPGDQAAPFSELVRWLLRMA